MADKRNDELLDFKRMKKWVDRSGHICLMFYPRWFDVTNQFCWTWNCYKETGEENIEVVKLVNVCWLNVRAQFKMSELSPGVVYEIAYEVKLTKGGSGWELPIALYLDIPPNRIGQKRLVSLLNKPREQWIELSGGCFQTEAGETGQIYFDLREHGGHWKSGLIVKGVVIRAKN